jgi:hypothetical protein
VVLVHQTAQRGSDQGSAARRDQGGQSYPGSSEHDGTNRGKRRGGQVLRFQPRNARKKCRSGDSGIILYLLHLPVAMAKLFRDGLLASQKRKCRAIKPTGLQVVNRII